MDRLETALHALRSDGRKILAPYLTCGWPDPTTFAELVRALTDSGADMFEIGIPFTDPMMDGPLIQRTSEEALAAEMRPGAVLNLVERTTFSVPFALMTYCNPVLAIGEEEFARRATDVGADGVIIPDIPVEEGRSWAAHAKACGLGPVFFAAPTTTSERMRDVAEVGGGFVYCVSLLGVTGVRTDASPRAQKVVETVRSCTDRPAIVGLGVSTPEHASQIASYADGVIVGSAVLKAVDEGGVTAAADLIARMRSALDHQ